MAVLSQRVRYIASFEGLSSISDRQKHSRFGLSRWLCGWSVLRKFTSCLSLVYIVVSKQPAVTVFYHEDEDNRFLREGRDNMFLRNTDTSTKLTGVTSHKTVILKESQYVQCTVRVQLVIAHRQAQVATDVYISQQRQLLVEIRRLGFFNRRSAYVCWRSKPLERLA